MSFNPGINPGIPRFTISIPKSRDWTMNPGLQSLEQSDSGISGSKNRPGSRDFGMGSQPYLDCINVLKLLGIKTCILFRQS